jgi:hypothetical protein
MSLRRCYLLTKNYSGDEIEKNEMDGACSTYWRQERCRQGFGGGGLREEDHLEDLGVDARKILK